MNRIAQLPSQAFHDSETIAALEKDALSLADEYDRDDSLYDLATRLVEEQELEQAERIARLIETCRIEQTWLFGNIAAKLWHLGQEEHARRLLNEAIPVARSSGLEWQRAESLTEIAKRFAEFGEMSVASQLWSEAAAIAEAGTIPAGTQDSRDASGVLKEIAECFASIGQWDKAEQIGGFRYKFRRAVAQTKKAIGVAEVEDSKQRSS